jgi:protein TonB
MLLNVGLIVSLILIITAFEWKTPFSSQKVVLPYNGDQPETLIPDIPRSTTFKNPEIPKLMRIRPVVPSAVNFKEIKDLTGPTSPVPAIDQAEPVSPITFGFIDLPKELPPPDTFRIVETMPEPVGGWETFYKTLKKHTKYPRQAQRMGTRGKVFVEFTVNGKGELSNFKVIKGIGNGCDEEACRVLRLTKWKAGKQRGRPVNVKMVQPMNFDLN